MLYCIRLSAGTRWRGWPQKQSQATCCGSQASQTLGGLHRSWNQHGTLCFTALFKVAWVCTLCHDRRVVFCFLFCSRQLLFPTTGARTGCGHNCRRDGQSGQILNQVLEFLHCVPPYWLESTLYLPCYSSSDLSKAEPTLTHMCIKMLHKENLVRVPK